MEQDNVAMNEGEQKHSLKLQVNEPPQNFDDNSMVFFSENDANKIGIFAGDIVLIKVFPWSILISVAFLACCTILFFYRAREERPLLLSMEALKPQTAPFAWTRYFEAIPFLHLTINLSLDTYR